MGWNKVHEEILDAPFCNMQQQIVKVVWCRRGTNVARMDFAPRAGVWMGSSTTSIRRSTTSGNCCVTSFSEKKKQEVNIFIFQMLVRAVKYGGRVNICFGCEGAVKPYFIYLYKRPINITSM